MILLLILLPALLIPVIARIVFNQTITWKEMAATLVIGAVIAGGTYWAGLYAQTADVEIVNGQVTSKQRIHDTYTTSHDCNCRTDSKGNRTCQTCHTTHYTVLWRCNTTVGEIEIDKKDSTFALVYNAPDPIFYTNLKNGDPVAREHTYTNYVKAVPDSLFHNADIHKFEKMIPTYPSNVYDYMKVDRAISVGVPVPDLKQWNQDISNTLRELGPKKQVNVVVLFANTNDQSYVQALEGKWIGGKKNDVIVVIGTTQYPKMDFVTVSSWTDNQLFKVQLRDQLFALNNIDRPQMMELITKEIAGGYQRKHMKDFEYLKSQIEPPTWVLTIAVILSIIATVAVLIYFHKYDPFD